MRTAARYLTAGLALGALALACGDGGTGPDRAPASVASCGSGAILTHAPVPPGSLTEIAPLGNLNPPGHVFPTDHLYFYSGSVSGGANVAPVVAPGPLAITSVTRQTRTGGGQPTVTDYGLTAFPCSDVMLVFAHLSGLSADVMAMIGAIAVCQSGYSTGGFEYVQCRKDVNVTIGAGAPLGTM